MEAFSGAVSLGYTHIEVDLRMTADGVVVCLHDATVDRTTDGSGPVEAMTYEELSRLDAGFRHRVPGGFPHRGRGIAVPTLEELVTAFPGLRMVFDLKVDGMARSLTRIIEAHSLHERVMVGSFSDRRLAEVRAVAGSRVMTSTGTGATRRWLLSSRLGRKVAGEERALQVPLQSRGVRVVDRRLVDLAHDSGLQVHVWTVNHRGHMHDLLDLGVDGLVTDRADILKEVLEERGEWPE